MKTRKITVDELWTPQFYIFPKVNKPNIPEKPAVSSKKILKFVDHFLQPHARLLPSYINDTSDFIKKLNEIKDIHKDTILTKLDIKSLYTSIPNHERIEVVKRVFNYVSQKPIATKVTTMITILFLDINT